MQSVTVTWTRLESGAYEGDDPEGNQYFMPAHKETVIVCMPDGRMGFGWTADEAHRAALRAVPERRSS